MLLQMSEATHVPDAPLPKIQHRTRQPNALDFNVRGALYDSLRVDLTPMHGIGPYLALRVIAECGTDLRRCPAHKYTTSWLTLSSGNKISGGKILVAHTSKITNRVTIAAVTLVRTNTALGAFYRLLAARISKAKAVTATARKIVMLLEKVIGHGLIYQDPVADRYVQKYRRRVVKSLYRRATAFGYTPRNPNVFLRALNVVCAITRP